MFQTFNDLVKAELAAPSVPSLVRPAPSARLLPLQLSRFLSRSTLSVALVGATALGRHRKSRLLLHPPRFLPISCTHHAAPC